MNDELKAAIQTLREARKANGDLEAAITARMKVVTDNPEFVTLVQKQKEVAAVMEAADADVRTLAAEIYKATGEKHPHPLVENTIGTEYTIENIKETEAWARTMLAAAFKMDTKMVLDHAKKNDVPGVVKKEVVKVRIATNLEPEDA